MLGRQRDGGELFRVEVVEELGHGAGEVDKCTAEPDCTARNNGRAPRRWMPKQIQIRKYGSAEQNSVASNQHTVIKFLKQNARQLAELDPLPTILIVQCNKQPGKQF